VHDLEIDQTRAPGLFVINNVRHRGIAVRPRAVKFITPELMSTVIFTARRFEHALIQRALVHVVPQALARQFVQTNCSRVYDLRTKPIAVQHLEAARLPTPPVPHVA
jgi:hypothetical protein